MQKVKGSLVKQHGASVRTKENKINLSRRLRELQNNQTRQKKEYERSLKKLKKARTAQETIRYEQMFEDGICNINNHAYSKTIKISDINYQSAKQDDQFGIFSRYCEILNSFDSAMPFQITIVNRKLDETAFKNKMLFSPANDILNNYRREMNDMLLDKALKGQNSIIREKYITFSGIYKDYFEAVSGLSRLESEITQAFTGLGCAVSSCSGKERVRLFHDMLRPNDPFDFDYRKLLTSDLKTKDYVSPMYFDLSDKSCIEYDDTVSQALILRDFPTNLSDQLISRISEKPINMSINIHLHSIPQEEALAKVNNKIMFMDKQKSDEIKKSQKKYNGLYDESMLSNEVRSSLSEAEELRDNLENNGQSMFKGTIIVYLWANTAEELSENVLSVISTGKSLNCQFASLDHQQDEGLNSSLPIGRNYLSGIERTLTTAAAAALVPFTNQELFDPGGIYYGTNLKSNNLLFLDRTSLENGNGIMCGSPGSGKSFAAKREAVSVLLTRPNDEVIFIDPEREYTGLAKGFDGTVVDVSAMGSTHINPLDVNANYADQDDPIALKSEFILSIVEHILGTGADDRGHFRSIVDRSLRITYSKFIKSKYKKEFMPTLTDFYKVLKQQPEEEARDIALSLEVYIDGSLDIFAHKTNVDFNKRLIIFDLKDLGSQLKSLGMMVVLDNIWNRITVNRYSNRRTWLYIDEMQLLLDSCDTYFSQVWSRARKWGAMPTAIFQNVEKVLGNNVARSMISNSDFILMTNQKSTDRKTIQDLLDLSDIQMNAITNAPPGQGLLCSAKGIIPFVDKFPTNTEIYKMITTKFGEI